MCEFYLICLALCLSACFLICFDFSCFVFCLSLSFSLCLSLSVFFSFSCFHFGVFFYTFKHCCTNRESVSWQLHLKHTKSQRIVISQVLLTFALSDLTDGVLQIYYTTKYQSHRGQQLSVEGKKVELMTTDGLFVSAQLLQVELSVIYIAYR